MGMGNDRKMGDDGADGSGAVVQWVVCEVSGGISYPVFTKTNYSAWALLMKVKLKAKVLWATAEKGGVDMQEDMMALTRSAQQCHRR
jgi:hypothetical protein